MVHMKNNQQHGIFKSNYLNNHVIGKWLNSSKNTHTHTLPQTKGKTQLYATYKKPISNIMTQTD